MTLDDDAFQEEIALKSIEIDIKKLHMKFSALNVDFDSPSLDFLGSRKSAREGIEEWYPCKSRYFTDVGQFFTKTIAVQRMNCDEIARDRLTVCKQELLAQIFC